MNSSVNFDTDLIKKYDTLAPRYTSYPTAPQFHAGFDETQFVEHAKISNESLMPKDLSVYVHIPFCHSLCYFCGCNKVVTQNNNKKVENYLEHLHQEITLRSRLFSDDRLVKQIHFGGGTPNFLNLDQVADVLDQIAIQFHLDLPKNLELGIELDPRVTNAHEIENFAKLGFNRFSIGVQDFAQDVQIAVNRQQDEANTLKVIDAAIKSGASVNVDLISGLPKQTVENFEITLDKLINTGVTRIAAYNFAYLPKRIKAQRLIDPLNLPDASTRLELVKLVRSKLLAAGYQHIGMDHYALPNDPLAVALLNNTLQRNFQGYTTHKDTDLIGVGASAISKFDTAFSQNETQLSFYSEIVDTRSLPIAKGLALNSDDRIRAAMIQEIMCRSEVDLNQAVSRFAETDMTISLADYFREELQCLARYEADSLVEFYSNSFRVTENGRYFMRSIAAVFDQYFSYQNGNEQQRVVPFSRTI